MKISVGKNLLQVLVTLLFMYVLLFASIPVSATSSETTNTLDRPNSPVVIGFAGGQQIQYCRQPIGIVIPCYQDSGGVWHCYWRGTWFVCSNFALTPGGQCPSNPTYAQTMFFYSISYIGTIAGYHTMEIQWTYCGHWDLPNGEPLEYLVAKNSIGQTLYTNGGADWLLMNTGATCPNGKICWQYYNGNIVWGYWVVDNLCFQGIHVSQVDHLNIWTIDLNALPVSPTATVSGSVLPNIC